ncbi:MAG: succinate-semialdehyde dehydrogenase (NADP(+)) [Nocardia sp.]|nr:succinate-semialdehyde dehydrogenase (NADP(+)) [Nocardia sp.]
MTKTIATINGLPDTMTPAFLGRLTQLATVGPDADTLTRRAPYTGAPLADLPVATPAAVEGAFATARIAQRTWAAMPVRRRAQIILRFHDLVLERQEGVLDLMQAEAGKTRRDAFMEVTDVAMTARYYARQAAKMLAPKRRRGAIPVLTHTTELRHPKGVVAVVSPWNYPLSMAATDALAALLAGNAVVQKPDVQTALTALWSLDLMLEAGLPPGVWQMVIGRGSSIGPALVDNADFMMFTGSTASGRQIARDAGERLIGASLELGGKNPMVVLPDADLNKVTEGVIAACFPSAGQLCVSTERIYVPEDVKDDLLTRIEARVAKIRLGAGYDYSYDMGSLTSESQLATVTEHVTDAVRKGARVVAGGRPRPDLGPLFYEPTVLTDVTPDMKIYREETFGPVVSVYGFTTEEQAVAMANDTIYGLNASVWTTDGRKGRRIAARIHAGTVNVNEAYAAAWGSVAAPMGGMGASGLGRRHGGDGLLKYTEAQTVAHQRLQPIGPPNGMQWPEFATTMTRVLRAVKRVGLS